MEPRQCQRKAAPRVGLWKVGRGFPTCWQPENTQAHSAASGQRALHAASFHEPFSNVAKGLLLSLQQLTESFSFLLKIIVLFTGSSYLGKMPETCSKADFCITFCLKGSYWLPSTGREKMCKTQGHIFWSWYLDASGQRRSFLQVDRVALCRDQVTGGGSSELSASTSKAVGFGSWSGALQESSLAQATRGQSLSF